MKYDLCVIGAGPGGYVCAIRAAQLGLKTVIVEKQFLGGVCLNVGCIPSKAMITAAHFYHRIQNNAKEMGINVEGQVTVEMNQLQSWKKSVCTKMSQGVHQLLSANGVEMLWGEAHFQSTSELLLKNKEGETIINAQNFVIATGSRPIEIPGFPFDEQSILSSTGALDLKEIPRRMAIIGGGYIGLEIGSYMKSLGTEITVIEATPQLLGGMVDREIVQLISRKLKKNGVEVILEAKAIGFQKKAGEILLQVRVKDKFEEIKTDKILVTVGRRPNSDQMNIKSIGLKIDEKGFIQIDSQRRTSHKNIFAIGDIACQPMLAHKASFEGVMVAEIISGQNRVYDVKTVPAVIFIEPEVASVGWTEEECHEKGYKNLKIGKFPFSANGRAVSLMESDGFIKVIADSSTHAVLGVHIVGPEASQLISEAALALEMGATLEDLALTIHPHPTLGEVMMEASEAALGHAIHMIQRPLTSRGKSDSLNQFK